MGEVTHKLAAVKRKAAEVMRKLEEVSRKKRSHHDGKSSSKPPKA